LFDTLKWWAWQLAPPWLPRCRGPWRDSGKQGRAALALWAERSGVSLEVIDADDSEIERLAVHRALARGPEGWRMVGIQKAPTAADALNAAWLGTN
jgi:hypothetical protein